VIGNDKGMEKKILITTSSFASEDPELLDEIKKEGFDCWLNPYGRTLSEAELIEVLESRRPVGMLAGTERIGEGILTRAQGFLKVISRIGVGWENVDLQTARRLGMKVFRTEKVLTQAVGELTIAMMLAALRNLIEHDRALKEGEWKKVMGSLLAGKVVGIIGYGEIGRYVGRLAMAFGAEVLYHDPYVEINEPWAKRTSLAELLAGSDIVSLHAGGREVILGEEELKACRRGVIIINTARGGLIEEGALDHLLSHGHIGYACLDVFEEEPYYGPLVRHKNVLMTPHVGSYAREARVQMERKAVENLFRGLREAGIL